MIARGFIAYAVAFAILAMCLGCATVTPCTPCDPACYVDADSLTTE